MKRNHLICAVLVLGSTMTLGFAQSRGIDGGGAFDNGDINADAREGVKEVTKRVIKIEYVAVSPERVWKSADENQGPITGTLLAFHREKETGKVSIVQNGTVRLLVGKQDFTLPLSKLSEEDQAYVAELVNTARAAGKLSESPVTSGDAG